jgi:NADH:ubiquinone oxidoreductase subunit 6 (subunit J)|tara:strand:- start:85 stop:390 length:306 start_codon:yes stop_codon:yes gene_type:complete
VDLTKKEQLQKRDILGLDLIVFWVLAGLILAAAWAVVNGNDIVHSVVWLSTVFLLTAGLFILAEAEFLAVIQVLVYVGAISVVIVFGIMLTKRTLKGGENV